MGSCPKRVILTLSALLLMSVQSAFAMAAGDFTGGVQELATAFYSAESGCDGTIGECLLSDESDGPGGEVEMAMESETVRRMLAAAGRYISYGALRRNSVPCSRRGASYYNCRPGAQANPYSRGCSRITRCRR